MEMVTIKTFDNYFSANIILSRLKQEGIKGFLKDEHSVTIYPVLANAIGGIKLVVGIKDRAIAIALLQEFEEEYLRSVQCPVCGEHDIIAVSKPEARNIVTAILTWLFSSYAFAAETVYQCQHCGHESKKLPYNQAAYN